MVTAVLHYYVKSIIDPDRIESEWEVIMGNGCHQIGERQARKIIAKNQLEQVVNNKYGEIFDTKDRDFYKAQKAKEAAEEKYDFTRTTMRGCKASKEELYWLRNHAEQLPLQFYTMLRNGGCARKLVRTQLDRLQPDHCFVIPSDLLTAAQVNYLITRMSQEHKKFMTLKDGEYRYFLCRGL